MGENTHFMGKIIQKDVIENVISLNISKEQWGNFYCKIAQPFSRKDRLAGQLGR